MSPHSDASDDPAIQRPPTCGSVEPHVSWALRLAHELHAVPPDLRQRQAALVSAACAHFGAVMGRSVTLHGVAAGGVERVTDVRVGEADDVGSTIQSTVPIGEERSAVLELHRSRDQPPFTPEDEAWLALIHKGLAWIYGPHVPDRPTLVDELSPRERETLEHLLAGSSEKEVAAMLGRSRHTVHSYVKRIYRRLGVNSRGELLAIFVDGHGSRTTHQTPSSRHATAADR